MYRNAIINQLAGSVTGNCRTHSEIELKNHLDDDKVIGYVTKDTSDQVVDIFLKPVASKLLGGAANKSTLERELKNADWK